MLLRVLYSWNAAVVSDLPTITTAPGSTTRPNQTVRSCLCRAVAPLLVTTIVSSRQSLSYRTRSSLIASFILGYAIHPGTGGHLLLFINIIVVTIKARCTILQSAVLRSHAVRPSICLSVCLFVCDVGGL